MHSHLFFFGPNPATQPAGTEHGGRECDAGRWSLIGDVPWMRDARGFKQQGPPKAGETVAWLENELDRVKATHRRAEPEDRATPDDVDRALNGEPHVVLAVEGARFLEGGVAPLQGAYELGIRHIQLVHYIEQPARRLPDREARCTAG